MEYNKFSLVALRLALVGQVALIVLVICALYFENRFYNNFLVVSMLGLGGLILPILIFSFAIKALKQIRKSHQKGRLISWIAIGLTGLWLYFINILIFSGSDHGRYNELKGLKAELSVVRVVAEIYHDTHGNYGITAYECDTPESMFTDTQSGMFQYTHGFGLKADHKKFPFKITCLSTNSTYVIAISLLKKNENWCVDSTGTFRSAKVDYNTGLCGPDLSLLKDN